MGKKIQITESELKSIIAESVKTIISEIEDMTYMNAAKKALSQGDVDRYYKFANAAGDKFKKNNPTYKYRTNGNGDGTSDITLDATSDGRFHLNTVDAVKYPSGVQNAQHNQFPQHPNAYQQQQRISDFNQGKYKYTKGRGWELNQ